MEMECWSNGVLENIHSEHVDSKSRRSSSSVIPAHAGIQGRAGRAPPLHRTDDTDMSDCCIMLFPRKTELATR
jgi:hypothetical protein